MNNFEIGTIIVQNHKNVRYEIIELREINLDEYEYRCKLLSGTETMWLSRKAIQKFIDEGKGHIEGLYEPSKNRLDSIE